MLKEQWVNEECAEQKMANQRFSLDRQRNQDLISHNEAERMLRHEAA